MAWFNCRACGRRGEFQYRPNERGCPRCGSHDVQIAVPADELPYDDPIIEADRRVADPNEE